MKLVSRSIILSVMASLVLISCGGPNKTVQRTSADAVTDLSGKWNDTDAKMVAKEMVSDCLSRPWLKKFKTANDGKTPLVRVRRIKNRGREHVNVNVFTKSIERELLNSGEVEFAAKADEISAVKSEQAYGASGAVADESAASIGNEQGVNFVMIGEINMVVDQAGGTKAKLYKITMELHDTSTAKKVWIGEKEIKKVINQKKAGW